MIRGGLEMLRVFPEHASRVRLSPFETPNEEVCHDRSRQPTLGSLGNKGPPASQSRAGRGGRFWTVRRLLSISRGIDQNVTLDGHQGGTCGTARSDAVGGIAPPSP